MAFGKARTRRNASKPATAVTYTVTVGPEYTECDSCCQPTQILIEQDSGAWICDVCHGGMSYDSLWKSALVNGMYNNGWGDGGEW